MKYREQKENARQIAIDWQAKASETAMSYGELAETGDYFYRLGKKYGLLTEFRENAIPC